MEPPHLLTEELKEFGINERNNIAKEKTKNKNQLYAFTGVGNLGENLTVEMYPETIGSGSKGGMAFDNKTLDDTKKVIAAKEVKTVSLIGTKECKNETCKQKCPPFQEKCCYCGGKSFKFNSDSRAGISSDAHIKYKDIIDNYIIFVQDYDDETKIISLKAYKFVSKNDYFDKYIQNQYDSGKKKGGTCNFCPYSYDWFMSGPITIMDVVIDINDVKPIITYHLYNPLLEIYDKVPMSKFQKLLNNDELPKLNINSLNQDYLEYEYISTIFNIRTKSIGKSRGITSRK
jgi:hypothetical protein